MSSKKALVMCRTAIDGNPRPMRFINCLNKHYDVHVLSTKEATMLNVTSHLYEERQPGIVSSLKQIWLSALGLFPLMLENTSLAEKISYLKKYNFDLILVESIELLPIAQETFEPEKVVFDAREYFPAHFQDRLLWRLKRRRLLNWVCAQYLPSTGKVFTVSQGIANAYSDAYCIDVGVIHSLPKKVSLKPSLVSGDKIKMVHHGIAAPSRKLERMIEIMEHVDERFVLDLYLVEKNRKYFQKLKGIVEKHDNVFLHPPVAFDEIAVTLNKYDIGICYFEPTTFNLKHTLPNKFFEYIQSGLAIAMGPSVEMLPLAEEYGFGISSSEFEPKSLALMLNELECEKLTKLKNASYMASSSFSHEVSEQRFLEMIKNV